MTVVYPGQYPGYPSSAPPAYPNYQAAPAYPTQPVYSAPPAQPVYSAPPAYPTQPYSAPPLFPAASPGVYGGYPPPAPPRRRAGLVLGIAGLAVVAVLAALGAFALVSRQEKNNNPTAGSPTVSPTAGASTPAPAQTDFFGDLRTLLLSRPANASAYDKPLSKDGTLTADQIAQLYPNPNDVKQILTNDGFESAAVAQWVASDNSSVEIKLYAFAGDDGAYAWSNAEAHAYTDDATLHDESPINGIDASTLVVDPTPDSDGYILTVAIAVQHNVAMKIFVYQARKATESVTIQLAQQQFARIP
jgi:hypothetical protein